MLYDNLETDAKSCSLYEHLVELMKYILEFQPTHALDQFETLSRVVKRERGAGVGGSTMAAGISEPHSDALASTEEPKHPEHLNATFERTLFHVSLSQKSLQVLPIYFLECFNCKILHYMQLSAVTLYNQS